MANLLQYHQAYFSKEQFKFMINKDTDLIEMNTAIHEQPTTAYPETLAKRIKWSVVGFYDTVHILKKKVSS